MSFTSVVSGETSITARGPIREAAERVLGRLWIDQVPVRLASEDAALWPSSAAAAVEGRALCWPGQPGPARALTGRIAALRGEAREAGVTEVALLGRGAPARAADLIVRHALDREAAEAAAGGTRSAGAARRSPLTVLDGPEPGALLRVAGDRERLLRTLVVVTGDDPATDMLRRVLLRAFEEAGLSPGQIARRFVIVADPGAAHAKDAAEAGHPVFDAPRPTVFGALSPYALVPAGLAGADVGALLDEATAVLPSLTRPENNPGLVLGAILGGAVRAGRESVVLGGYAAAVPGLADWIAPLLAEGTGGRLLPIVQRGGMPVLPTGDMFLVTLDGRPRQDDATVSGPPAAQLVVWEYAVAVAAYLLGVDPLGPPVAPAASVVPAVPVAPAVPAASGASAPPGAPGAPNTPGGDTGGGALFSDGDPGRAVEVHTSDAAFAGAGDLPAVLDAVAGRAGSAGGRGHLSIVAYLDPDEARGQGTQVRRLAGLLAARCARPVTVAWGCRYPAFGNDHQEKGVYLMVTGNVVRDVPVPDRHHRLGAVQLAQALADARAARGGGRPVVRLHLQNRWSGLARLLDAARGGA
ncbi:glucose-6-phosphate isomerase [Actinomadura sp. J1-007]|uniref:glucose-6-phosphate isomerase n=1 Tax=Actinomadura sp. J1-007 TaxID=2661913 RepID=UPI0013242D56|nr:glucose-6-phosphate isomerase [Actinomadura sp. J1-007]MWK39176.1 glucose-6-phosphate isomerase [Actinomadura sp. J1-007]